MKPTDRVAPIRAPVGQLQWSRSACPRAASGERVRNRPDVRSRPGLVYRLQVGNVSFVPHATTCPSMLGPLGAFSPEKEVTGIYRTLIRGRWTTDRPWPQASSLICTILGAPEDVATRSSGLVQVLGWEPSSLASSTPSRQDRASGLPGDDGNSSLGDPGRGLEGSPRRLPGMQQQRREGAGRWRGRHRALYPSASRPCGVCERDFASMRAGHCAPSP